MKEPSTARERALFFLGVGLLVAALPLAACPGSLEDPERFMLCNGVACTPTTADVLADILKPRCTAAGCHSGNMPAGQLTLDVDVPGLQASLYGKTSSTTTCLGRTLVSPGDPEQSLLYLKLQSPAPCGSPMPLGVPLSQSEQAMVRAWIEGLATP